MLKKFLASLYVITLTVAGLFFMSNTVKSQDMTYQKALTDYDFTKSTYSDKLTDFNEKKAAYQKNQTLALKEELRLSLFTFLGERNNLIRSYLTTIRFRAAESQGLSQNQKETVYTKIDTEVKWYENHKNTYLQSDLLETLLEKSKTEDKQWTDTTTPAVYFVLSNISLGDVTYLRQRHEDIYNGLKTEADSLVSLGRADNSLFSRWFNDIEKEINNVKAVEAKALAAIEAQVGDKAKSTTNKKRLFDDFVRVINPGKTSLLKLNNFISELENVVQGKR